MTKLLIVISSDIYVRNYLTTDAFSRLEQEFDCHFIADRNISMKDLVAEKPGFQGFYGISSELEKKHQQLFNLMMWRYRKRSRTFLYRWLRNSQWHLVDRSRGRWHHAVSVIRWVLSSLGNPQGIVVPLFGNRVAFPIISRVIKRGIPLNSDLKALVLREGYGAVLFPSAAFDSISVDIARVCESLKVPSLCLIDNWDNLSSKTVFWAKPSHIGVWGPQAREQAQRIHEFEPHQIHEIGTPRFDQYFFGRASPTKSRTYGFPYVLFVGSAMPFDEISTLHKIEDIIVNSVNIAPDLQVVYRPHPWQQKRAVSAAFNPREFRRVLLDEQIETELGNSARGNQSGAEFQPALSYYPNLLRNAAAVVGPLTTMLLEASICLRPVVAINYDDGVHRNTSLRYFSHFDGAENVPGFTFCNSQEDLEELLLASLGRTPISADESENAISYFLHQSKISYPERLLELVATIIEKN